MTRGELAAVEIIDAWLDDKVSPEYKAQPLAQDWARICKETEEKGEAIAELILATGQNPRKGRDPAATARLLEEMADRAWTCILGIQHFTKDAHATGHILDERLKRIRARVPE